MDDCWFSGLFAGFISRLLWLSWNMLNVYSKPRNPIDSHTCKLPECRVCLSWIVVYLVDLDAPDDSAMSAFRQIL
jgi:hypothetical protein